MFFVGLWKRCCDLYISTRRWVLHFPFHLDPYAFCLISIPFLSRGMIHSDVPIRFSLSRNLICFMDCPFAYLSEGLLQR